MENKIPSVRNLVNKADYNTKVTEIENKLNNHNHDKYINTPEINKLAAGIFTQANLITKAEFDCKLSCLNRKITQNKSKHLLLENELNKLKTFDSSYFIGKSHFEEDGTQNYLVFQTLNNYFTLTTGTKYISSWKSKGLSEETIVPPPTFTQCPNPLIDYVGNKIRLRFNGSCLKQPNI